MRKPYKGNILQGRQHPGNKQTLRYIDGKELPHYPVPVDLDTADIAINWASLCCLKDPVCPVCLDSFMDGLEVMFPEAFD